MEPNILTAVVDYQGIWHWSLFVLAAGAALSCLKLEAQTLLWGYIVSWTLVILLCPIQFFGFYHRAFEATAGQTLALATLLPFTFLKMRKEHAQKLLRWFKWIIVYEIYSVWRVQNGLMSAPSFNTALIAMYLPFAPLWLIIASLITIVFHHGTIAVAIVFSYGLVQILKTPRSAKFVSIAIVIFSYSAALLARDQWGNIGFLMGMPERLAKYKEYLSIWVGCWQTIIFGTGAGSFMWLSLMRDKFAGTLYLCMHSDWLQILFEYGVIGAGLAIAVFISTLKKCWNNDKLLMGVVGGAVCMVGYHPWRFAPTMFLMLLILKIVNSVDQDLTN